MLGSSLQSLYLANAGSGPTPPGDGWIGSYYYNYPTQENYGTIPWTMATDNTDLFVAGTTIDSSNNQRGMVTRINGSDGSVNWNLKFNVGSGLSSRGGFYDMALLSNGSYIYVVGGDNGSSQAAGTVGRISKVGPATNDFKNISYSVDELNATAIDINSAGTAIYVGYERVSSAGPSYLGVTKLNESDLSHQWTQEFAVPVLGGNNNRGKLSSIVCSGDAIYVCGYYDVYAGASGTDLAQSGFIWKFDSSGNLTWGLLKSNASFAKHQFIKLQAKNKATDSGIYVAGTQINYSANSAVQQALTLLLDYDASGSLTAGQQLYDYSTITTVRELMGFSYNGSTFTVATRDPADGYSQNTSIIRLSTNLSSPTVIWRRKINRSYPPLALNTEDFSYQNLACDNNDRYYFSTCHEYATQPATDIPTGILAGKFDLAGTGNGSWTLFSDTITLADETLFWEFTGIGSLTSSYTFTMSAFTPSITTKTTNDASISLTSDIEQITF